MDETISSEIAVRAALSAGGILIGITTAIKYNKIQSNHRRILNKIVEEILKMVQKELPKEFPQEFPMELPKEK